MSNPKFLLDENLSPTIRDHLTELDATIDIVRIGDENVPPLGTLDEPILEWIADNGYILVTDNRRSMPKHLENHFVRGNHIPGILLIRRGTTLGEIIEELWLIWQASEAAEHRDRIQFIPL